MLLFALLSSALVQAGPATTHAPLTDPEAYAVIAAVISSESPATDARVKRLVIQNTTTTYNFGQCFPEGEPLRGEWKPVVDDYKQQNRSTWTLMAMFPLERPYDLVSKAEIMAPFKAAGIEGWDLFYKEHPDSGGYINVSAVGFDADKTRAMLYVGHSCGGLCGSGMYHFMEKVDRQWREAKLNISKCMWIS